MNKQDRIELKKRLKRRQTIWRFSMYGLAGVFVALFTAVTVLVAEGNYINPKTHQVIKNGLVFVDSRPSGATIKVNGTEQKSRTASRLVVPEAKYDISLHKDGYRTWQRSFFLGGSEVVNLDYPLLIPETIPTQAITQFDSSVSLYSQSPDQKWLLLKRLGNAQLDLYDISRKDPTSAAILVPASLFPEATDANALKVVSWSADNQHFLVSQPSKNGMEFAILSRSDPNAVNINRTFGLKLHDVKLRDGKYDKYFALDESNGLRELDLSSKAASAPILDNVASYKTSGPDRILYVQQIPGAKEANVILANQADHLTLTTVTAQDPSGYLLDFTNYDNDWFIVVSSKQDSKTQIFKNSFDNIKDMNIQKPFASLSLTAPEHLSFSHNAQFIATQSGNLFAVYDNKNGRTYHYKVDLDLSGAPAATWIDGNHLVLAANGHSYVIDYDGINLQDLGVGLPVAPPAFDRAYEQFFTLVPNDGNAGVTLQRRSLLLTQ